MRSESFSRFKNLWVRFYSMRFATFLSGLCLIVGCRSMSSMQVSLIHRVDPADLEKKSRTVVRETLGNDDPALRCHALECVGLMDRGPETIGWLQEGLTDPVPAVRFAAALAAGDVKAVSLQAELDKLARDEDPSVKMAAAYALEKMGDQRFGGWYDYVLASDNASLCAQACLILGKLDNTSLRTDSAGKLWNVLRKEEQHVPVRLGAAEALARLGDANIRKTLLGYANSGFADDRIMAISGLKWLNDPVVISMLVTLTEDPQIEVSLAAVAALGSRAADKHRALARENLNYSDSDPDPARIVRVRGLAILALGATAEKKDLPLLAEKLKAGAPYLRITTAKALLEYLKRN